LVNFTFINTVFLFLVLFSAFFYWIGNM